MSRKLRSKQIKAAHLLASGKSGVDIARTLKIRPETLSRWKRNNDFIVEIDNIMNGKRGVMRHRLEHLAEAAVSTVWSELERSYDGERQMKVALNVLKLLGIERIIAPIETIHAPIEAINAQPQNIQYQVVDEKHAEV